MNNAKITSSIYAFDSSLNALQIQITIPTTNVYASNKHIIIVLDNSGSMAGSGILQAKEAICELISVVQGCRFTLVVFNSYALTFELDGTVEKNKQRVMQVSATGGTNFSAAFDKIGEVIKSNRSKSKQNVAVIFFTDGQDGYYGNYGKNTLDESLKSMQEIMAEKCSSFEFHTIGFTGDHDARLLDKITKIGSTQGTFQYVKQSADIKNAIGTVSVLVQNISLASTLHCYGKLQEVQKVFLREEYEGVFTATNFIRKDCSALKLKVEYGGSQIEVELAPDIVKEVPEHVITQNTISYVTNQLLNLMDPITSPNAKKHELESIKKQIQSLDEKLEAMAQTIRKLKNRMKRKEFFTSWTEAKELVGKFNELLASAMMKTLTNDKIASINSLAYKGITKKSLQKKLDKRIQENVILFEKIDNYIEKAVKSLNFDHLRAKYNPKELGTCALSCQDWIEALEQSDCMCITLDIVRPQSAIADPSQVIIKEINQTLVTAESFLDTVEYKLKIDEKAHGGFGRNTQGSLVVGVARENITGVLPLFLNEEHWSVAKHKMKPIMGWMATLDIMGYAFSQIKTIPFLVLAKAVQDKDKNEFKKKQFKLIFDTCIQIYKDASKEGIETKLSSEVIKCYNDYIANPASRTIDVISNNQVFLGQLLCAFAVGDLKQQSKEQVDKFFSLMAEEELRRGFHRFQTLDSKDIEKECFKMLGIDKKRYITDHVEAFRKEQERLQQEKENQKGASFYQNKIVLLLESRGEKVVIEKEDLRPESQLKKVTQQLPEPEELDGSVKEFTPTAKNMIKNGEKIIQSAIAALYRFKNMFLLPEDQTIEVIDCKTFADIGADTNEKILALLIQNIMHAKNSDRRQAIAEGKYKDPMDDSNAKHIIRSLYISLVKKERNSEINQILASYEALQASNVSGIFAKTTNIYEAAGCLLGVYQGKSFNTFFRALQNQVCPLAIEKIKMLLSGQYRGIPLICDKIKTKKNPSDPVEWHPSKQNIYRLWKRNKDLLNKEEWIALFGQKWKDYFEKRYKFLNKSA